VPGAPLEIRWALQPQHHYAFTGAALTQRLWGLFRKDDGTFEAVDLAPIGDTTGGPLLAVDMSLSSDDRHLFVTTFMDGSVHVFDVSNPRKPAVVLEQKIGKQLNMVSQSWDGKRVYFTSSLLANWDKTGADDEQFLRVFDWDGKALAKRFEVDFEAAQLGRPHIMNLGSESFYQGRVARLERP
jgi:selenium-binding protein 1